MLFPTRPKIRKALLKALADGEAHDSDQVEVAVAQILGLSDAQRREPYGNGGGTRLGNEIDWVKGAADAGFAYFERVGPKLYRLTSRGKSAEANWIDVDDASRTVRNFATYSPAHDLDQSGDSDAEILRRDPRNTPALNRTGRRYVERGDSAKAIETFERVLAIDPTNDVAIKRLRQLRR